MTEAALRAPGAIGLMIVGGIVGILLFVVLMVGLRIQARRRRTARRAEEKRAAEREIQWTWFSRANLDDGGRTWLVGIERVNLLGDELSPTVYVTDDPIPRDDFAARGSAETTAMQWASEYNVSRTR